MFSISFPFFQSGFKFFDDVLNCQIDMGCVFFSNVDISGNGYRIKIIKEIAKGGFGNVLLCEDVDGNDKYAVKKIMANSIEDENRIKNEAKMHKLFENVSTIVQLIAFINNSNEYFLVFPFYSKGTIQDELEKRKSLKKYLTEEQILRYFESICDAVSYLHDKNYAHRDLKPANFLISNEDDLKAHLTDFGSSSIVPIKIENSKDHYKYLDEAGELCSMAYRAPELFSCNIGSIIDKSIDIWSLGCCLYSFCFFSSPFDTIYEKGGSIALATQSPHKIDYSQNLSFSSSIIDLIKSMLKVDCESRPKIEHLLEKVREIGRNLQNDENPTIV